MIRSHLDFAGPLFSDTSDYNKTKLKSIQYYSMRANLNKKYGASGREMHETLCIETLDDHFIKLKNKYLYKEYGQNGSPWNSKSLKWNQTELNINSI